MEQERLARRPSGGAWEGFRLAQGEGRHLLESWPCGEIDEIEVGWVFWSIVLIIMIISYVYIVIHTAITVLSFVWRLVWRSLDSGSGIFASTWVILRLRNFGFGLVSLGRCWGLFFFFPVSGASASLPGALGSPSPRTVRSFAERRSGDLLHLCGHRAARRGRCFAARLGEGVFCGSGRGGLIGWTWRTDVFFFCFARREWMWIC